MARLLRVHFASIGHRDARLAPLTLDFRHGGEGGDVGRAADSVVWLRNGGGKSSILNLFYSVFRPSSREFLGSSAEGRARRLHDYVEGRDLAFVVTEWDVEPADDLALFSTAPTQVRIAGQVLAWKGQRRSADAGNLRRLFFSLRARPEEGLSFEALPIHGLGEPAETFDAFRQWLRDTGHAHSAQEVVFTESQKTWVDHLEKIGLDPELFRYQLRMNQREGAADEAFRFTRDEDFVRFLLELALEREVADGVAQTLGAQQENLRCRPLWELDRRFVGEGVGAVRALAGSVRALGSAEEALADTTWELAGMVAGLDARIEEAQADARRGLEQGDAARERVRLASNERDMKQRWVRGLERLALVHDEAEARAAWERAKARLGERRDELAHAEAGHVRVEVRAREAEQRELREALRREQEELEPMRRAACARGASLYALLDREQARRTDAMQRLVQEADAATREAEAAEERRASVQQRRGRVEGELHAIDDRIDRRDRARESLLRDGVIERREAAAEAVARWRRHVEERERATAAARTEREAHTERLETIAARRGELLEERGEARQAAERLETRVRDGLAWRDRLAADARIGEVEEVDAPDLEAAGLVDRLRRRAAGARRQLLASRVDGAEDDRSLEWLREHGLLPGPVDVQRVVDAIQARGHAAHPGPAYLEQNLPSAEIGAHLVADPARFGGVVVTTDEALEAAAALAIDGLRAPVQVTLLRSLDRSGPAGAAHVVLPDAGLWDRAAADERRAALHAASTRRTDREAEWMEDERATTKLADDVERFLAAHGGGGLVRLEREVEDARARIQRAQTELEELDAERARLADACATLDARVEALRDEVTRGTRALEAVEHFVEAHEQGLDEARRRKDDIGRTLRELEAEAGRQRDEAAAHRERARSASVRATTEEQAARSARAERDAVDHRDPDAAPDVAISLGEARAAYETASRQYEGQLSESRILWQLDQCAEALHDARARFEQAAAGCDRDRAERWADREDLDAELERLREAEREQSKEAERRGVAHEHAERLLDEQRGRRRDAEDLPADRPKPEDAASARAAAEALLEEVEALGAVVVEAQEAVERAKAEQAVAERLAERCRGKAELLRGGAEVAGTELPEASARVLPPDLEEIDRLVQELQRRFKEARQNASEAERTAKKRGDEVRAIANGRDYASLEAQYRERMKDPDEILFGGAAALGDRLAERLAILDDALAKLDEDRRLIVEELLHLADQVGTLLRRAETSSRLPASLEGWGGKPYLRIGFAFPERDDERRARLAPLVDRLVDQAQLPSGLELVLATAVELAGPRAFDVKILKPDTVLRPEPVALSAMSTFSRGQQLTAAILLYCTLVQLRARSRGRSRSGEDAGVLILDNPIGTCSNVALLRLQRTIAARMRVQLVYTTGVDDLDALATLPNKIRLRNSHRDRTTGAYHVTADPEAERGVVEGVRLVEVPAR